MHDTKLHTEEEEPKLTLLERLRPLQEQYTRIMIKTELLIKKDEEEQEKKK